VVRALETLKTVASIAGPVIGIASLVAAFIFYRRQRKYMELSYEISPVLSLVQVGRAIQHRVEVKYDGEPIEHLSGVSVEMRSSGTEPVEFNLEDDSHAMETPVTLDFGQGTRLLGEPTVEPNPKNLKVSAIKDPENQNKVILDKFLLNPGQSVTVSTFGDKLRNPPKVYANIKGVAPLRERTRDGRRLSTLAVTARILGVILFIIATIIISFPNMISAFASLWAQNQIYALGLVMLVILPALLVIISVVREWRS
jgi:hypothetical protein